MKMECEHSMLETMQTNELTIFPDFRLPCLEEGLAGQPVGKSPIPFSKAARGIAIPYANAPMPRHTMGVLFAMRLFKPRMSNRTHLQPVIPASSLGLHAGCQSPPGSTSRSFLDPQVNEERYAKDPMPPMKTAGFKSLLWSRRKSGMDPPFRSRRPLL